VEKVSDKIVKLTLEADGNIVGESFIVRTDNNSAAKLGVLFGVIEACNINDAFLDGFLNAVNDLKTEYYLPPYNIEHGVEKRFEEAICRANRRIFTAINQSAEEIDLRNLSAAVGLWHNNRVYLSSSGRAKALFFRRKKNRELLIIDILSGNGETRFRPEPERIFANILSGEISNRDALILINEEFLGFFSQKELGEAVLDNNAADAARTINDSLLEKIAKKNFYAVIVTPETAPETKTESIESIKPIIAASTSADQSAPIINRAKSPEPRAEQCIPASPPQKNNIPTQQSIDRLLFTQVRTEKYLTPSLLPPWQKILLVGWTTIKNSSFFFGRKFKKYFSAAVKLISERFRAIKSSQLKIARDQIITDENDQTPADYSENTESPASTTENIAPSGDQALGGLTGKINYFLNAQIVKYLGLKRGQKIILAAGLVLIFLFSQSIVMIGRSADDSNNSSANGLLAKQIEIQLDSAEAQNIFNDELGALASLKQARELLTRLPDKRSTKSLKAELQNKIKATAGILQKIRYLDNPTVSADFSADPTAAIVGLAQTGKVIWAYDNANQNLLRFDTADQQLTAVAAPLPPIKQLTAIDDNNLILLADGSYYKFNIADGSAAKIKPNKDWFRLKLPGEVSPLIDPTLASSTIAMSTADGNLSFFLDGQNGRIVVTDKNSVLKRQYYSAALAGAGAFAVSTEDKKIRFYNSGKVYQIDLDF